MSDRIIAIARAIQADRYPDASVAFAAGSIVRGEATRYSDLDLVVVYPALKRAYRESFRVDGLPVEAFVHDPQTLEYFFVDVDRPSGIPALAQMVLEGIEIPAPNELSIALKERAAYYIEAGPAVLEPEAERRMRYAVTDLLDDLRDARSHEERLASGSRLFEQLADYYFRSHGQWSARGKAIPRTLQRVNADLAAKYCRFFDELFRLGDATSLIQFAEELLEPRGGPLFEGYRSEAPAEWRRRSEQSKVR